MTEFDNLKRSYTFAVQFLLASNVGYHQAKASNEMLHKFYENMVEQNAPNNMEAVFFSAYGKAMLSLTDSDYYKRQQKFKVLDNSISVINDYFEVSTEDKEVVLKSITSAILKMYTVDFVFNPQSATGIGGKLWQKNMLNATNNAFLTELKQIAAKHSDSYIQELILKISANESSGGCYVATCVYGSYDCPQVWTLRRYRDYTLAKTWYGRAFIRTYYTISPTLVKWFGNTEWFKRMWKPQLDSMVNKLQASGYDNTPYQDKHW